ncbi:hypothetical protein L2E82_34760 [Cichorium intybus]|uniref:Uncharacterized protein n=1 Tax=Cichorium intybus TaxID=13427 RepID=A0ACB9BMQ4_CICIN|nr:hypothetical protein L2E82_34760 [Cichorium intybus]
MEENSHDASANDVSALEKALERSLIPIKVDSSVEEVQESHWDYRKEIEVICMVEESRVEEEHVHGNSEGINAMESECGNPSLDLKNSASIPEVCAKVNDWSSASLEVDKTVEIGKEIGFEIEPHNPILQEIMGDSRGNGDKTTLK